MSLQQGRNLLYMGHMFYPLFRQFDIIFLRKATQLLTVLVELKGLIVKKSEVLIVRHCYGYNQ